MTEPLRASYAAWVRRLEREYGPLDVTDPDLVREVFIELMDNQPDDDLFEHFRQVALCSRATGYEPWLAELEAVIHIYGGRT